MQMFINTVTTRATEMGMKVNEDKTKILRVAASKSFKASAVVSTLDGGTVKSVGSIKVLGVILSNDANFKAHTNYVVGRIRSRIWALRSLKKTGMCHKELVQVYTSLIRPLAEHAGVVWHYQLTAEQSACIEYQQTLALRNIFGAGISAVKLRKLAGVELLSVRRERRCLQFALQCVDNPRFSHWFGEHATRRNIARARTDKRKFREEQARTDRHMNSLINYMKRLLNRNL